MRLFRFTESASTKVAGVTISAGLNRNIALGGVGLGELYVATAIQRQPETLTCSFTSTTDSSTFTEAPASIAGFVDPEMDAAGVKVPLYKITCPVPEWGRAGNATVEVRMTTGGTPFTVPWRGKPGGNVITFAGPAVSSIGLIGSVERRTAVPVATGYGFGVAGEEYSCKVWCLGLVV